MKAAVYNKYGPSNLNVLEVPKPNCEEHEVLVRVKAASINSWDWNLLLGKPFIVKVLGGLVKPKNKILGADIAGVVEAAGSKVTKYKVGDRVFGDISNHGWGGFAEYVAVPEEPLSNMPDEMTFEQAAALGQAAVLALQSLRLKEVLKPKQKVLINGAGGGVGTIALQLAKYYSAEVTCVDKQSKHSMLSSLGADHVIDFAKKDYTKSDSKYDLILDNVAHRSVYDYKRALTRRGTFVMLGGNMDRLLLQILTVGSVLSVTGTKRVVILDYKPSSSDQDHLATLFSKEVIKPIIDRVYSLETIVEAMEYYSKSTFVGKVIITM